MGYETKYRGCFKFTNELKASELAYLGSFFGEDCRDHPEWGVMLENYYVDLRFTKDYLGIEWNGSEKTYDMPEQINFIIDRIRERNINTELEGKMSAQGEEIDDRYDIIIQEGRAIRIELTPPGTKIECPHCKEEFYYEG
jgi:hypothetical protein